MHIQKYDRNIKKFVFLTQILVNCPLYCKQSVDISNPQNLVCGHFWTFLMSAHLSPLKYHNDKMADSHPLILNL